MTTRLDPYLVLGAGPAGLTAAYALARRGLPVVVLEREEQVGGLAKTVVRDGYRFDLGGHRFFTKSDEVRSLWDEILGDELLLRPRLSRIYWNGRFLDYPLRGTDVVRKLGPIELTRVLASYAVSAFRPKREEESFEDWVVNRFGRRLFELFFKPYTEKVWGVSTSELRAEWAAQRIKGLSLVSAAKAALFGNGGNEIRTLIHEFHYPRLGPGQMWETMAAEVEGLGGEIRLGASVERLHVDADRVVEVEADDDTLRPRAVISSLPLRTVAELCSPEPPAEVAEAAGALRYRDFLTVALVLSTPPPFPDNWIYVHDPGVRIARIQNYAAWSPALVPEADHTSLGLEFFCFEGDELWNRSDDDLVALGSAELEQLGLASAATVERGYVVRVPKAYPMYDDGYAGRLAVVRRWLEGFGNLEQVGRNGLHRYNNSDHSMLTALRAVENVTAGAAYDVWAVNTDSAYHEQSTVEEHPYRRVPEVPEAPVSGVPAAGR